MLTYLCHILPMQLTRTTVRLTPQLKRAAEAKALELNLTFQAVLSQALELYLSAEGRRKTKRIIFRERNLGVPLDNLNRDDLYAD